MRIKRTHREWQVVGQPRLDNMVGEESLPRVSSRRRHVREQEHRAWIRRT